MGSCRRCAASCRLNCCRCCCGGGGGRDSSRLIDVVRQPISNFILMQFHPLDVLDNDVNTLLDGVGTSKDVDMSVAQFQQLKG